MTIKTIAITDIEHAIFDGPAGTPPLGVTVSDPPDPYIAPDFRILEGHLNSEVIIKAQAAVGKTVTAAHLSASRHARLLDLANTRVASYALRGAVEESAFHLGQCPIIVDALDEGALLSNDDNRDAFLFTSRDLLLSNRTIQNKVKVVFLGRPESADWTREVMLEDTAQSQPISVCMIEVSFFREQAAKDLVMLYSTKEIGRRLAQQLIRPSDATTLRAQMASPAMSDLVHIYFSRLETALELGQGQLWKHHVGRSFAGYAPTLAAIGELLATTTNPHGMLQALDRSARSAWDVIDQVINKILVREQQEKILPPVRRGATGQIPGVAYNEKEQFEYLTQVIQGGADQIDLLERIKNAFGDRNDLDRYREVVAQQLPQHPFLKDRAAANDVLGAKMLAGAICGGLDTLYKAVKDISENRLLAFLEKASRQPFLWRFVQSELSAASETAHLLHGIYIGYIVNSYLNDPAEDKTTRLTLREGPGGEVEVRLGSVTFGVMSPVRLYGEVAGCTMRCQSTVLQIVGMGNSKFVFQGRNELVADTMHFSCRAIGVTSGSLWLDPKRAGSYWPANFGITVQPSVKVGWGENIASLYPWRAEERTLKDPMHTSIAAEIVERMQGKEIVVLDNYDPPDDDHVVRPIALEYGVQFRRFLKALVDQLEGVNRNPIDASGSKQKFRIVGIQWPELLDACQHPSGARGEYEGFVKEIDDLL